MRGSVIWMQGKATARHSFFLSAAAVLNYLLRDSHNISFHVQLTGIGDSNFMLEVVDVAFELIF